MWAEMPHAQKRSQVLVCQVFANVGQHAPSVNGQKATKLLRGSEMTRSARSGSSPCQRGDLRSSTITEKDEGSVVGFNKEGVTEPSLKLSDRIVGGTVYGRYMAGAFRRPPGCMPRDLA